MEEIIKIENVTKKFRRKTVLSNLSLDIKKGEIYGIIGNNGAGKTTLLRIICGLLKPNSGKVTFFTEDEQGAPVKGKKHKKHKKPTVGLLIENPGIYGDMSAYDNIKAKAIAIGAKSGKKKIKSILKSVGLDDTGKKSARAFSTGMKQRLGIALALVGDPDILVLDEPINGLDPEWISLVRTLIQKIHEERGTTILISSHLLDELAKTATRFCIIHKGVLLKDCTKEEFVAECGDRDLDDYFIEVLGMYVEPEDDDDDDEDEMPPCRKPDDDKKDENDEAKEPDKKRRRKKADDDDDAEE